MNKLLSYININKGKDKIEYSLIAVLLIYNFAYYISFLQNTKGFYVNWYDFSISLLSSYMNMAYFYFSIFLIYIYNVNSKKNYYKYLFLRFKNRKEWYTYNILNILVKSIKFTSIIIIQAFLQGIITLSFRNKWSEYSIHIASSKRVAYLFNQKTFGYVIETMTPLKYIVINIIFIIFFFLVLGLIYLILSMLFKSKLIVFVSIILLNCVNIGVYLLEAPIFVRWTFYYNTSVITAYENTLNSSIFYNRFLYWILLIFILVLIGSLLKRHVDFEFGDDY